MKSPGTGKLDQQVENDLINTLGIHVAQSAKVIFNIKNFLYELVKINVSPSAPARKYDNVTAVVAGSKRNLDDLRRVQSMLKGYINTLKNQQEASEEEINLKPETNAAQTYSSPSAHKQLIDNTDLDGEQESKLIATVSDGRGYPAQKAKQTETKPAFLVQIQNLQKENNQLKSQISKLKNQTERKEAQNQKQLKINPSQNSSLALTLSNPSIFQLQTKIQSQLREIQQNQQQNPNVEIQNAKFQKLKHCKSAIFETSKNLHVIKSRNKQCLELINTIKKQIGLQLTERKQK